jgi:hypothetical protein
MEALGLSNSKIRNAVAERLAQEGIDLPSGTLNRVFGTCGILGLATLPLHMLRVAQDFTVERIAGFPNALAYTVGGASTVTLVVCGTVTHQEVGDLRAENLNLRAQMESMPKIEQVDIGSYSTGSRACDAQGLICVSVARSHIQDHRGRFFGYSTPTCAAKVIRRASCQDDHGTDYAMSGVVVQRSPNAHPDADVSRGHLDYFCLSSEKGKRGIYEFANCVHP